MKLQNIKPVFDTTYSKTDKELMESAVDFLGTLKAQTNFNRLDPNDVDTKNKIALFVGLLSKVKQFKAGKIGPKEMMQMVSGVTRAGDSSNEELDIMHDMANDPAAVKLRDDIISSLQKPQTDDSPEEAQRKTANKQKFLKALTDMQNAFYSKLGKNPEPAPTEQAPAVRRTF